MRYLYVACLHGRVQGMFGHVETHVAVDRREVTFGKKQEFAVKLTSWRNSRKGNPRNRAKRCLQLHEEQSAVGSQNSARWLESGGLGEAENG